MVSDILLSVTVQKLVAILVLSQEMSACPSTLPSWTKTSVSSCGRNTDAKCVGWVQLKLINPKVSGWTLTIHLTLQDWPWFQKKRWWPSLRGLISKSYILLRVGWECTREQGGALFSLILLTFWVSGGGFCNVIVRSRFASTKPSFRCKGAKHKIPLDSAVCSNQLCGREQPAWTVPSPGLSPPGGM